MMGPDRKETCDLYLLGNSSTLEYSVPVKMCEGVIEFHIQVQKLIVSHFTHINSEKTIAPFSFFQFSG